MGDEFEIGDTFSYSDIELMSIDDTREPLARLLSPFRLAQQVVILREEHTPQSCSAVEQFGVRELTRAIFLRSQYIHTT